MFCVQGYISLSLHGVWLSVSLFVSICWRVQPFLMILSCEYKRIPLVVILLFLFLFTRSTWFYTKSQSYLVYGPLSLKHCQVWVPCCIMDLSQIRHWLFTPTSFVQSLPWYILQAGLIVDKRFCSWFGVCVLFLVPYRASSNIKGTTSWGWRFCVRTSYTSPNSINFVHVFLVFVFVEQV